MAYEAGGGSRCSFPSRTILSNAARILSVEVGAGSAAADSCTGSIRTVVGQSSPSMWFAPWRLANVHARQTTGGHSRQKFLNLSAASSEYLTVCWMFLCPR
jgi:hypothetical protein